MIDFYYRCGRCNMLLPSFQLLQIHDLNHEIKVLEEKIKMKTLLRRERSSVSKGSGVIVSIAEKVKLRRRK